MVETFTTDLVLIRTALQRLGSAWVRLDLGVGLALGWLLFTVILTVWLGPRLGLRGLTWMTLHHALCLIGCSHELRRGWHRHRERRGKRTQT